MYIAKKYNLKVKALMSLGHTGESNETANETKQWLLDVKPDDFDITIISPYPGSPYFDQVVRHGGNQWVYEAPKTRDKLYQIDLDYNNDSNYYKGNPTKGYTSFVYTDHLTSDGLVEKRDEIEKEVRTKLNIPFYQSAPALMYEHSMGQTHSLPSHILKT